MTHIVLLGDSIFDNASYTRGGPDVITQVRELLPPQSKATLLAVDGSTTLEVPSQLERQPSDASHLVLSVGGNDALMKSDILNTPIRSSNEALLLLADVAAIFEQNYRSAVDACLQAKLPLGLCTIYNGCFDDVKFQCTVTTALKIFNDAILRVGFEFSLPLIDLRFVCSTLADYANPIEPSSVGGAKIARAIVNLVSQSTGQTPCSQVFVA
jgi:GDSL-like Lipase/Acylhydrolase family